MIDVVLFDLDGTLSDSAPGILGSLRRAFAGAGLPPLTAEQEAELLGPPFYDALPPIIGPERVDEVITAYRRFYGDGGMFDTTVYPGIVAALEELRAASITLAVATSKPEHFAIPILERLGLAEVFTTIGGDTLEGHRGSKALVVGEVLRRLGGPRPSSVVMVGDRSHDVHGAAAHGVRCYGAGWGYGAPGELADAGAVAVYATPDELMKGLAGERR